MKHPEILAKGKPDYTPLQRHLEHVASIAEKAGNYMGLDIEILRFGALLHDIGKAHPVFQKRLNEKPGYGDLPFRHEIASLFFLSLFSEEMHEILIEMIIAHHKSVLNDSRGKGILDLVEEFGEEELYKMHIGDWHEWSPKAISILTAFGLPNKHIVRKDAENNFYKTLDYCDKAFKRKGYSEYRGILQAADHFASALIEKTHELSRNTFKNPVLDFFNRKHELYPLSLIDAYSSKSHTIVVACTGAGKTDFLFRRCKGRVFYTLPFQASINAMYHRVAKDLKADNPGLDIRLLHAASSVALKGLSAEEKAIQGHVGSAIKVLTPHQIASIVFGTYGYEATLVDIKGCDVILDEIHTYTDVTRAIVLKIVHVLKELNCRIHIGTATMPSVLYREILRILGKEHVYEVQLEDHERSTFDRHIVHKLKHWNDALTIIQPLIHENKKILLVCNRVRSAQAVFENISKQFPDIPSMLIHSRFKRGDREIKENQLLGLDHEGNSTHQFNTADGSCIVVSTQVVEVSLDISFDVMITETAPLDALIQRFGRIHRKRSKQTLGTFKPVYVIQPPEAQKEASPYDIRELQKSFEQLPDGDILHETEIQQMIDAVFPEVHIPEIEEHAIFKNTGEWMIQKLTHRPKSVLLEMLDIDSVACILEKNKADYIYADYEKRILMEIPCRYWSVQKMEQLDYGHRPFIVPDNAYDFEKGLMLEKINTQNYNVNYQIL